MATRRQKPSITVQKKRRWVLGDGVNRLKRICRSKRTPRGPAAVLPSKNTPKPQMTNEKAVLNAVTMPSEYSTRARAVATKVGWRARGQLPGSSATARARPR